MLCRSDRQDSALRVINVKGREALLHNPADDLYQPGDSVIFVDDPPRKVPTFAKLLVLMLTSETVLYFVVG